MSRLAAFVEAKESRTIAYRVYFGAGSMTVVQVHPDSASMEEHLAVAAPAFAAVQGMVRLETMDVYGEASPALVAALEGKARLLGTARVDVHRFHAGFARF